MDHDQTFKHLLLRRMEDFFRIFFAEKARRIDFSYLEPLDKEVFTRVPEGFRRESDMDLRASEPLWIVESLEAGWKACPTSEQPNCDTLIRRGAPPSRA